MTIFQAVIVALAFLIFGCMALSPLFLKWARELEQADEKVDYAMGRKWIHR
jgi:hypothetical protein